MVYLGLPIKNGDFPWQTVSHNQMVETLRDYLMVSNPRSGFKPEKLHGTSGLSL